MKNLQMTFVLWAGLLAASVASAQDVSVFVDPQMQSATLGSLVTVAIRLDTKGLGVEAGGVFLQFDSDRLHFTDGANNTTAWNNSIFNTEPAETQPGIVSLFVGANSALMNAGVVLVSTLHFTTTVQGTAQLTLLFNAGAEETVFYQPGFNSPWPTTLRNGSVTIGGTAPSPSPSPSPSLSPTTPAPVGGTPTSTRTPSATRTASATATPSATRTPTQTPTAVPPIGCADQLIRAVPDFGGGPLATDPLYLDPLKTLGPRDSGAYSLSNGGLLEVRFVDNFLTNSGDDRPDLAVFEVGGNETSLVALRPDAATLALIASVGTDANHDGFFELPTPVSGDPAAINIDSVFLGFARGALRFDAVQLVDVKGTDMAATVGVDINAVCAIDQPPAVTTFTPTPTSPTPTPTATQPPIAPNGCADVVIRADANFSGGPVPTDPLFIDPMKTLGPSDFDGTTRVGAYALGNGGLLEVRFVDNVLTNSGDDRPDLVVFEVGGNEGSLVALRPDAATLALISSTGVDANHDGFFEVTQAFGAAAAINIDRIFPGFARGALRFDAVQLVDVTGLDTNPTIGADIDAICVTDLPPAGTTFTPTPTPTFTPTPTRPPIAPNGCADAVIRADASFSGGPVPTDPLFIDPMKTLGPSDFDGTTRVGAYALGNGGLLEARFVDNVLTNSGDDRPDLVVFEIGGNEASLVALRPDAATLALISSTGVDANHDGFFEVTQAFGAAAGINIDGVFPGFTRGALRFDAVQLVDVTGLDTNPTIGADIDAICVTDQAPAGTTTTPTRTLTNTPTRTPTRTPTTSATATRTTTPTMTGNAPRVVLSNTTTSRGATAPVGASLEQHGQALVAVQLDLGWAHDTPVIARANGHPDCTVDPAIQKPDSTFAFIPSGCQGASCTAVRALVFSLSNVDLIPDHAHLFTCNAQVAATAAAGPHPLSCSGASGSGADANTVGVACDAGQISIVACKGDCDGSSLVDIAEVVRIVNIALGSMDLATCPIADGDGDGAVTISDIIAAVNSVLTGCPG